MRYKEDIDFKFFDYTDYDDKFYTAIELLVPKYKGVCYLYHQARVVEHMGEAKLQYSYTIIKAGDHDIDVLNSDEELFTIMGDILHDLLLESIRSDEQTGKDNPEKFIVL